ncbi:DUF481 domain-containing protein [Flavihumibacter fluvii]|uniref:DUF481 domain-containing protein n=1 Tax=Flavihumibacter fluvii TaxID=2838157 RepID=UPI001BDE8091|nr:DUF481 domain-containing protein [Flavihumibacter fluvii]ULQ54597.1 DUF481 domain-containing protein [Flavihumibacter fluvii]
MKFSFLNMAGFLLVVIFSGSTAHAQKDTIITKQGALLIGSISSFVHGRLTLSTDYTYDAFPIKWSEVAMVKTQKQFKVFDRKGNILVGKIRMDTSIVPGIYIFTRDTAYFIPRKDIGQLSKYETNTFRDRFNWNIDVGFVKVKANNTRQLDLGTNIGYEAKRWELNLNYYSFASLVDTIMSSRGNLGLSISYFLPRNWFLVGNSSIFRSSEQQIDYRVNNAIGFGKYAIRKNNQLLRLFMGINNNQEKYTSSTEKFGSTEAFGSFRYEYYLPKGLNVVSDLVIFPSLTETNRVRSYFNIETRIKVIRHFHFGIGYTLNYDSKPPVNSSKSDYILNVKLGWSLK